MRCKLLHSHLVISFCFFQIVCFGKSGFSQFDQSTEGIILGTDGGYAKFEVATDNDNYLSFDGQANTLDIKAETFGLKTTKMVISSSLNNGTIAIGATPPVSATSGTGIYMDGSSNFLVGASAGNHIQYLAAGTVDIQSTIFSLNATTLIIDSGTAITCCMIDQNGHFVWEIVVNE